MELIFSFKNEKDRAFSQTPFGSEVLPVQIFIREKSHRFDLPFNFLGDLAYNFLRIWMILEVKA